MKIYFPLIFFLTAICATAKAEEGAYALKVECNVDMLAVGGVNVPLKASSVKFENSVFGFGKSQVKISLGDDYILTSEMTMLLKGSEMSEMVPAFRMTLFKGNPVQGKVNFAEIDGLDLDNRTFDVPLKLSGSNFIDIKYGDKMIRRVDYCCLLTKIAQGK